MLEVWDTIPNWSNSEHPEEPMQLVEHLDPCILHFTEKFWEYWQLKQFQH